MCGAAFAGMLSLLSSGIAIGMLLPRAISMMNLVELAKRKAGLLSLDGTLQGITRSVGWCSGIMLGVNAILVFFIATTQSHYAANYSGVVTAGLLLAVQCSVATMGMANSMVLMTFEQGGPTAKINLVSTSTFAILAAPCYVYGGHIGLSAILILAIAVTIWRNRMIRVRAHEVYRKYAVQCAAGAISDLRLTTTPKVFGATQ
jgi:O-antigen/teichoic acid export membrane protein